MFIWFYCLQFLTAVVSSFTSGEHVPSCTQSQLFCKVTRKCVERSLVCISFISCSDTASSNISQQRICFKYKSEHHTTSKICLTNWLGPQKGFCYFLWPDLKKSWFEAEKECRALHQSGQLMSLTVSDTKIASIAQGSVTNFVWLDNGDLGNKRNVLRGKYKRKYRSRKKAQCTALLLSRNHTLITQIISRKRNCNAKLNFICQLSIPEVNHTSNGSGFSSASASARRRQAINREKNRHKFVSSSEKEITYPLKVSSHVEKDVIFSMNSVSFSTPTAQSPKSTFSLSSRKLSFSLNDSSILDAQLKESRKEKIAPVHNIANEPLSKVRPSWKLENLKEASQDVAFKGGNLDTEKQSKGSSHPPLPLATTLSNEGRTGPQELDEPMVFADDSLGGKRNINVLLPNPLVANATSISQLQPSWVVFSPRLTSLAANSMDVTPQLNLTSQSVFRTRHFTPSSAPPSSVFKPTQSRTSAVNFTTSHVFTEPSTQATSRTTAKTPKGFFQSKIAIIGVSAGGGALLLVTLGIVLLCCCLKRRRERTNAEQAFRTSVLWDDSNWDVRFSTGITSLSSNDSGHVDWAATVADGVELTPNSTTTTKTFLY